MGPEEVHTESLMEKSEVKNFMRQSLYEFSLDLILYACIVFKETTFALKYNIYVCYLLYICVNAHICVQYSMMNNVYVHIGTMYMSISNKSITLSETWANFARSA